MSDWKIEYDNDTGPGDEGYCQWWNVTDGIRSFECKSEEDAKWLQAVLMMHRKAECLEANLSAAEAKLALYNIGPWSQRPPDVEGMWLVGFFDSGRFWMEQYSVHLPNTLPKRAEKYSLWYRGPIDLPKGHP